MFFESCYSHIDKNNDNNKNNHQEKSETELDKSFNEELRVWTSILRPRLTPFLEKPDNSRLGAPTFPPLRVRL